MNQRNETEPPPANDDFDFEDFGPEDLELIRGATPVEEDDDSHEEWEDDPLEQMRREEQHQWLQELADPFRRVVEMKPRVAAVIEGGTLYVVTYYDNWTELGPCRARGKSDDEIRKKVKFLLPFL